MNPSFRQIIRPPFLLAAAAVFVTPFVRAQQTPRPTFAVATIKPIDPNLTGKHDIGLNVSPGTLTAKSQTLRDLIKFAYTIRSEDQLTGGPGWIGIEQYDIEAKADPAIVPELQALSSTQRTDRFRAMLQTLLADRFHLKVDHATRQLPVFALTVAKNGSKLTETLSPAAGQPPLQEIIKAGAGRVVASHASLQGLVNVLSQQPEMRSRIVLDHTGLQGVYTFLLVWTPESAATSTEASATPDSAAPSLFTALQEQLGLKLETTRGPVETTAIDSAEKPAAN